MTGATANGSGGPWDLDAAEAAAGEADAVPFTFTYKGESYSVPPSTEWPMQALRLIGRGDLDTALPMMIGQDAYDRLSEAGLKFKGLNALFQQIAQSQGLTSLPNSGPSRRRASTRT